MAERVYMTGTPPRLITSKPGYNASTSLDNVYKTFDSNWFQGAGIRWIFRVDIPSGNPASKIVTFPYALNHIPRYSLMWGGYSGSTPPLLPLPGVEWPFSPNPGGYFYTDWQSVPAPYNPDLGVGSARIYNNRFEMLNTLGLAGGRFFTLIVYQS